MAKHNEKGRLSEPWLIRRVFYAIIGLIGAVLFGFGIADADQIDQWSQAAERLAAPILMILTSGLAGVKANPGSDGKTEKGQSPDTTPTTPTPTPPSGNDLLTQMRETIAQNRGQ